MWGGILWGGSFSWGRENGGGCGGYIYYIGDVKFSILGNKISILQKKIPSIEKKIPSIEILFCSIGIFCGWDVRFCR